mmetsp:Transcript_4524/g.9848  ORF Transcript_4524/g.9848 Transcript_4524/m.9848 type:complete len:357 (+) Transcript_4524:89-1159(+)
MNECTTESSNERINQSIHSSIHFSVTLYYPVDTLLCSTFVVVCIASPRIAFRSTPLSIVPVVLEFPDPKGRFELGHQSQHTQRRQRRQLGQQLESPKEREAMAGHHRQHQRCARGAADLGLQPHQALLAVPAVAGVLPVAVEELGPGLDRGRQRVFVGIGIAIAIGVATQIVRVRGDPLAQGRDAPIRGRRHVVIGRHRGGGNARSTARARARDCSSVVAVAAAAAVAVATGVCVFLFLSRRGCFCVVSVPFLFLVVQQGQIRIQKLVAQQVYEPLGERGKDLAQQHRGQFLFLLGGGLGLGLLFAACCSISSSIVIVVVVAVRFFLLVAGTPGKDNGPRPSGFGRNAQNAQPKGA